MTQTDETPPRRRRNRRRQAKFEQLFEKPEPQKGLNPVDLLTKLSPDQKRLVNWLARRRRATLQEMDEALKGKIDLLKTLRSLIEAGYVRESFAQNRLYYRVVFGGRTGKLDEGLPQDIWARIDLDKIGFLRQMPVFSQLSEAALREAAGRMALRRHERDDVILWQGQAVDKLYFIKSGVVGITHISPNMQDAQLLAHLRQGDVLGEYSLLSDQEVTTASATATALSGVELLVISHADFRALMDQYPSLTLGMARMLVNRLLDMNPKRHKVDTRLSLVFGVEPKVGRTLLGSALALMLGRDQTAVYTEYPAAHHLIPYFDLQKEDKREFYALPAGYDVAVPDAMPSLPAGLRTALVFEKLSERYTNIVIGLPGRIDNAIIYLLERADQLILVSTPEAASLEALAQLRYQLRTYIHPEKTAVFHVVSRPRPEQAEMPLPGSADYAIPHLPPVTPLRTGSKEAARPLLDVAGQLADRLGRTNQISLYIPTTVSVDQAADTSAFVEKSLEFMGSLFGGATSSQAQGVWNSEEVGLVGETVYIVRSYAAKADLDRHLPQVLSYVEQMKYDLEQEAMAVEVNQKLMLL